MCGESLPILQGYIIVASQVLRAVNSGALNCFPKAEASLLIEMFNKLALAGNI